MSRSTENIYPVELSGGPRCGLQVDLPAQPPEVLLVECPIEDDARPGFDIHAYKFANRSALDTGRWIYTHAKHVGRKGGLQP
jgi:hypothetical protein